MSLFKNLSICAASEPRKRGRLGGGKEKTLTGPRQYFRVDFEQQAGKCRQSCTARRWAASERHLLASWLCCKSHRVLSLEFALEGTVEDHPVVWELFLGAPLPGDSFGFPTGSCCVGIRFLNCELLSDLPSKLPVLSAGTHLLHFGDAGRNKQGENT